jgi:PAS domain S-box-containing protein
MGDEHQKSTETALENQLRAEILTLRAELKASKQMTPPLRNVDTLVIDTPQGRQIYTLQGADRSYRAFVEEMTEGAVMIKADGTIGYCNQSFADILGRPLVQILGTQVAQYVAPVDQPAFLGMLRQGLLGSVQGEIGFLTDGGAATPTHVGISLLLDRIPATSVAMVVTILTELKRAEQFLDSDRLTRRLIDGAPIGIAVVGQDLRYILANADYQSLAFDPAVTVVGRTIIEVLPSDVAQIVESSVRQVLHSELRMEFREFEAPMEGGTRWNMTEVPLKDAAGITNAVLLLTEKVTDDNWRGTN